MNQNIYIPSAHIKTMVYLYIQQAPGRNENHYHQNDTDAEILAAKVAGIFEAFPAIAFPKDKSDITTMRFAVPLNGNKQFGYVSGSVTDYLRNYNAQLKERGADFENAVIGRVEYRISGQTQNLNEEHLQTLDALLNQLLPYQNGFKRVEEDF